MPTNVALIGNPNVGKTVIFNNLTGSKQHVANWPGVTVEKKEGKCEYKGNELTIVDLPGTYSLTAHAMDELIARNYILTRPDVVLDIVDASNIERNLYLTMMLLELEANVVVALNMMDVASKKGYEIDVNELSRQLGVPVVPTVAIAGNGLDELKGEIVRSASNRQKKKVLPGYGKEIENEIKNVAGIISKDADLVSRYPSRWLAIKALEQDEQVLELVRTSPFASEIMEAVI